MGKMAAEWITAHAAMRLDASNFRTFAKGSVVAALPAFPRGMAVMREALACLARHAIRSDLRTHPQFCFPLKTGVAL